MMKEYAEPHFDDEQTILSARPVVPLEQIKAKTRHRRIWFLGGAFVLAMMLGSASALLALYLTQHDVPQAVTELPVAPEIVPAPVTVAEAATADTMVVENENSEDSENSETSEEINSAPEMPKRESATRRRTVAATHKSEPDEPRDTRVSEEDELKRIREAVLYDQWEERRARRATRRERRRAERYNDRDLSNLNEIFEGRGRRRP